MGELDNLYKEVFEQEVSRRHQMTNYLPLRVTLTGVLSTFFLNNIDIIKFIYYENTIYGRFLYLIQINTWATMLSSIFIIYSIYFLIRFHFVSSYLALASPDSIMDYSQKMNDYVKGDNEQFEREVRQYLVREYIDCASHNMRINDKKSENLRMFDKYWALSALFTMILFCSKHIDSL